MVEVFKTNLQNPAQAQEILGRLKAFFPHYTASFDLEDCDRILRIVGNSTISPEDIINFLIEENVSAEVLL